MKKIAITGTMCSGKTFLLNIFAELGFKTFNSDLEIKKLLKNDLQIKNYIKLNFPGALIKNLVDKKKLAEESLSDQKKFLEYEKFIHNKLREERRIFVQKNQQEDLIFFEVPLLFEKDLQAEYDIIILADATERDVEKRLEGRLLIQNKATIDLLRKKQIPNEQKKNKVDFIVNCSKTKEEVQKQIFEIIKQCAK